MKRLLSAVCAVAIAFTSIGATVAPASAQSLQTQRLETNQAQLIQVQQKGSERRFEKRGNDVYLNGKKGSRERRNGYQEYNGYWFPAEAFAGAIIGGVISGVINGQSNNKGNNVRVTQQHVDWCNDRYRSYRASDNTFQPNKGSRQRCVSPYSK